MPQGKRVDAQIAGCGWIRKIHELDPPAAQDVPRGPAVLQKAHSPRPENAVGADPSGDGLGQAPPGLIGLRRTERRHFIPEPEDTLPIRVLHTPVRFLPYSGDGNNLLGRDISLRM